MTDVVAAFAGPMGRDIGRSIAPQDRSGIPESLARTTPFCTHPGLPNTASSETEMLRTREAARDRDLSLTACDDSLGSCTMKLNATTEMIPHHLAGL